MSARLAELFFIWSRDQQSKLTGQSLPSTFQPPFRRNWQTKLNVNDGLKPLNGFKSTYIYVYRRGRNTGKTETIWLGMNTQRRIPSDYKWERFYLPENHNRHFRLPSRIYSSGASYLWCCEQDGRRLPSDNCHSTSIIHSTRHVLYIYRIT